jgi:hypothetical protein
MSCKKDVMKHRHHIIPRYMGGSDEEHNLVEITITQHAMFHYCNYQLWGNTEDYVAWRGLSGTITEQEFLLEKYREFGKRGAQAFTKKLKEDPKFAEDFSKKMKELYKNPEYRSRSLENLSRNQPLAVIAALSPETREKRLESFRRISHQQGETNSQYGKKWIHNVDLRQSTMIDKDAPIPDGWNPGRIQNFDSYIKKLKIKEQKIINNKRQLQDKIKYFTELYQVYLTQGFQYIKKEYNYDKTQENLILSFRTYAEGYEPYKKLAYKTPPLPQPSPTS